MGYKVEDQIKALKDVLDSGVIKAFNLSKQEKSLLDYSNSITIPMLMKHKGFEQIFNALPEGSQELETYIKLILNKFTESFKKNKQKLIVEIHHTNQLIGLFFKLVPLDKQIKSNLIETDNDKILKGLSNLGNEKITDRLFIQKDIRGFEKDGFYIVGLTRKGYGCNCSSDLNEFTDMLTAGKNTHLMFVV